MKSLVLGYDLRVGRTRRPNYYPALSPRARLPTLADVMNGKTIFTLEAERAALNSCPCSQYATPARHLASKFSAAAFHSELSSRRPVIIEGAGIKDWPASHLWNHSFFEDLLASRNLLNEANDSYSFFGTASQLDGACPLELPRALQGESVSKSCVVSHEFFGLESSAEYFERARDESHAYCSFTANEPTSARLLQQELLLPESIFERSRVRDAYLWIFLGTAAPWAHVRGAGSHHDDFATAALVHATLRGRKGWVLHPPPECASACEPLHATVSEGEIFAFNGNFWRHSTYLPAGQPEHVSVALFYCPSAEELREPTCDARGPLRPHETPSMVLEACRRQAGIT